MQIVILAQSTIETLFILFSNGALSLSLQQIKEDVDEHNRPINNTLDIIAELVETGADVLSSAELNKLQSEGKNLKSRYDNVADNSDKLLKRLVAGLEELSKFRGEVSAFRSWLEKAYKILEDKEKQLADLRNAAGNTGDLKAFVSDVMTHGADLKFLTISGQKFVDLSKVTILFHLKTLTHSHLRNTLHPSTSSVGS